MASLATGSTAALVAIQVCFLSIDAVAARAGLTNLSATAADGSVETFSAAPARWNAWQPQAGRCPAGSRWRCSCPTPAGPEAAAVSGRVVPAPAFGHKGLGVACGAGTLPPAPPRSSAVLLARRGECAFHEKAAAARERGYCGLLVSNLRAGPPHPYYGQFELPDMTAEGEGVVVGVPDSEVGLPAWLVSRDSGDSLVAQLQRGALLVEVRDETRKPPLGNGQEDDFGLREYRYE